MMIPRSVPSAVTCLLAIGLTSCSGTVTNPPGVIVGILPRDAQVFPGDTVGFVSTVTGTANTSVQWTIVEAGGGSIDATGLYTAPQGQGQFHVKASSQADPLAQAIATVTVTATPVVAVTISPNPAAVAPGGSFTFSAMVTGTPDTLVAWSILEGSGCGSITQAGVYTAPAAPATCHVVATSHADPTKNDVAVVTVTASCWRLLPTNRVRFVPRVGQAAAMVAGKIQGSNDSPTNGFVDLALIASAPAENPAYTEIAFQNATAYRWIKYWGPPDSYGQIAEIEFYSDATRLTGAGFGTSGSRSGHPWQEALDGDTATFFDGPVPSDVYVGIDAASDHLVAAPIFSPPAGTYASGQTVTISTTTPGAAIRYTTDGSDPAASGIAYAGPIFVGSGATTVRAIAYRDCMTTSAASSFYQVGGPVPTAQSSLHLGNSLTDSIDSGWMTLLASSGGFTLDYWRYTIPGIGTYIYPDNPTGGSGLQSAPTQNVQDFVKMRPFDHISFQPAGNMTCLPYGHAWENPGINRSDAVNIAQAWSDAVGRNPSVQMWVFATWVAPSSWLTCMTGRWNRDPAIWNPTPATDWTTGVDLVLQFGESTRNALAGAYPTRPPPYIVPGGLALKKLKAEVEAGGLPGVATNGFWSFAYQGGFGSDDHLTTEGRYFITLVFYACMFKASPIGLTYAGTSLTAAQALKLQQVAWDTVNSYLLSGVRR